MQLSEHVHAVKIPFKLKTKAGKNIDRFVYSFLIYGSHITLIDAGTASSENLIFDYIRKTGRRPEEITNIILTHSHPDHLGAVKAIKEAISCNLIAHSAEKDWIEDVDKQFAERPLGNFYTLMGGSVKVDQTIEDGDMIYLGDDQLHLRVIHSPGHSNGSSSYFFEKDNVLISGDALPIPGEIPIYDDPYSSVQSIVKLMEFNNVNILLSSWCEPVYGPKISQYMNESLAYIKQLHNLVTDIMKDDPSLESNDMCLRVLEAINIPGEMLLPLVVRSLTASLKHLDKEL